MIRKWLLYPVSVLAAVGCATSGGTVETVTFPPPGEAGPKFVKTFVVVPRQVELTRWVWDGASIDDWTEALEIVNSLRRNSPPTPAEAVRTLVDLRVARCPGATSRVLHQDESSVLYEVVTIDCPPHPDEHSINRLIYGPREVFSLIYTNKVNPLPLATRERWIDVLSRAALEETERGAIRDWTPVRGTH
jgi:hypothetical protein